jgi:uncharacterized damage-inducible protein DinB
MNPVIPFPSRRNFLLTAAAFSTGLAGASLISAPPTYSDEADLLLVGPRKGFSPQIGTLVSEMAYTRSGVLTSVKGMTQKDLDFLFDPKANTIGALLLHLVAVETFYQAATFEGLSEDKLPEAWKEKWGPGLELGDPGRKLIKDHPLDYYLNLLNETREKTLSEFRKRDDAWLTTVKSFGSGKANYYWMWFHVCEHESNHNGQIKFLKSRLPGAKPAGE